MKIAASALHFEATHLREEHSSLTSTLRAWRDAGMTEVFLPLPGVRSARFAYMDKDGKLHAQWPPKLGLHEHLPSVVLLNQDMDDGGSRVWAAAISGARNPYVNPFEDDYE